MKRKVLFILLALGLTAMIWAQQGMGRDRNNPGPDRPQSRIPAAETVTVSGSLIIAHGLPAVKSGDVTYIVRGINRLAGFVEGLKEGAQITIEGSSFTNPRDNNIKFLRANKLTLNGKNYDLTPLASPSPSGRQFNPPPGLYRYHTPPPGTRRQFERPNNYHHQQRPQAPRRQR